ncbi:7453_t:CDS:2 [Dentiscutata erythropus]|uniref:7453_t:CDS:1 n=1 Tax=Dentiscutata erythropus TaxID=1348616 RepID=A0A9N9IL21_9GLOM|nr:7453_t:CDS:2 [Dentiscutata erythropus]
MKNFIVREWTEIISDPVSFGDQEQKVAQHVDLPVVKNELSITLRISLKKHSSDWASIFHKGTENLIRTPGLWFTPHKSALHARFTGNWNENVGIGELNGLLLQQWYHITYTLSDPKKRLDIYINGEWSGYFSIQDVRKQNVIFNDGPMYIGKSPFWNGFNAEIRVRIFLVFLVMALVLIAQTNARKKCKSKKKPRPIRPNKPYKPHKPTKSTPTVIVPPPVEPESNPTTAASATTQSCRMECPACVTATPYHCMLACRQICD